MSEQEEVKRPWYATLRHKDWDAMYREGMPPWEANYPNPDLVRVVTERRQELRRCAFLEIGCGTGADAISLAKQGFQVTAVDSSATAIERARTRAEQADALLRIVLGDVFSFARHRETFDFVFDIGFYQFIRRTDLKGYLDLLWSVTHPGSYYFTVCGASETALGHPKEPPLVTERELHWEVGRLFEIVEIKPGILGSPFREEGFPAHACLMRRPVVGKK